MKKILMKTKKQGYKKKNYTVRKRLGGAVTFSEKAKSYKENTLDCIRINWNIKALKKKIPYQLYINNVYTTDVLGRVDNTEPANGKYDIDYSEGHLCLKNIPLVRTNESRIERIYKIIIYIYNLLIPGINKQIEILTLISETLHLEYLDSYSKSVDSVEPKSGWKRTVTKSNYNLIAARDLLLSMDSIKNIFIKSLYDIL